jgi:hypothetical protein
MPVEIRKTKWSANTHPKVQAGMAWAMVPVMMSMTVDLGMMTTVVLEISAIVPVVLMMVFELLVPDGYMSWPSQTRCRYTEKDHDTCKQSSRE